MATQVYMILIVQRFIQQWYVIKMKDFSLSIVDLGEVMKLQHEVLFIMILE
jgi:hypothetical protein